MGHWNCSNLRYFWYTNRTINCRTWSIFRCSSVGAPFLQKFNIRILIIGEKRFQYGDRIKAGSIRELLKQLVRSTVVRNFDSSPMLIPNKDLSDVYVTSGEMDYRRIDWK